MVSDWRWLYGREDTPWYPTMRLFRRKQVGDWAGVFDRMAEQLRQRLAAQSSPAALEVAISPGELIDRLPILNIKNDHRSALKKQINALVGLGLEEVKAYYPGMK